MQTVVDSITGDRCVAYSYPRLCPESACFSMKANGQPVFVYRTSPADFAGLAFSGRVEIEVECRGPIKAAVIRPLRRGIVPTVEGNRLRFALTQPANLSIEIEDAPSLFLFADALEIDVPARSAPGVHYFAAGQVYEVGELRLRDGETVYIEGGAVVRGCVRAEGCRNIRVGGRGVLDGGGFVRGRDGRKTLLFESCEEVRVEDIVIIQPSAWVAMLGGCRGVRVRNLREVAEGHGSDGIDIVSCRDVVVEGCFLRNGDDCIVVKALERYAASPAGSDVRDVLVKDCVLLNVGAGNALEIGHELRTASVSGIVFRGCDVLCVHGHGAALSIHNAEWATVSDVLYEDIRIEHYFTYLIEFRVLRSRWSRGERRGWIRDVRVKDLQVDESVFNPGYSVSLISGCDPEHRVERVTLQNLRLGGRKVRTADDLDLYTRNATGIAIE